MNEKSVSRILVLLLLFLGGLSHLGAQNVSSFVKGTTHADNKLVVAVLTGPSLTDATAAAKALGGRRDPQVGDILEALYSRISGPQAYRYELLFREVFEYVFLLPNPAPSKMLANSGELSRLIARLQSIGDGATKRALLDITTFLPATVSEKALLDEGAFLERYLRESQGHFSPGRLDEALGYLRACRIHSNEVLRAEVVGLVEVARDAVFVREARRYLSASK